MTKNSDMNALHQQRIERLNILVNKGYKYCHLTGNITNKHGRLVTAKNAGGYICIAYKVGSTCFLVRGHHFAWYVMFNQVVEQLDHINGNRTDNRICNLRSVTNQENHFNETRAKGYHYDLKRRKWRAEIMLNRKSIHLGRFATEDEARKAYLKAKEKYHVI